MPKTRGEQRGPEGWPRPTQPHLHHAPARGLGIGIILDVPVHAPMPAVAYVVDYIRGNKKQSVHWTQFARGIRLRRWLISPCGELRCCLWGFTSCFPWVNFDVKWALIVRMTGMLSPAYTQPFITNIYPNGMLSETGQLHHGYLYREMYWSLNVLILINYLYRQ